MKIRVMAVACMSTLNFINLLNLSAELYKGQSNFISICWQL